MKKFISIVLSAMMILSIFTTLGVTVSAKVEYYQGYRYKIKDDKTIEITEYSGSLSDVSIPDTINGYTVTSIGDYAFGYNTRLENVTIPDSVTKIDSRAFNDCAYLKNVNISKNVEYIGYRAFDNCRELTDITLPNSVKHIGEEAFKRTAYYKNENNWNNNVLYIDNHLIIAEASISDDYIVQKGTLTIADSAFSKCTNLTSISIPDTVTSIGNYTFYNCTSLKSIVISDSVTSIGNYTFYNCTSLKSIVIPDSVTSIGYFSFYYCTNLTSVTIGNSVTSIGSNAFGYNTSLTNITIPDSVTSIGDDAFYNTAWFSNHPEGLVYVGKVAYKYKGTCPETVEIRGDTVSITYDAFSYCENLKSITIPDSVTSIKGSAFYNCTSLTSITIPDSVTSIGEYAFYNCTSLTSITIPDSVTSIGDFAFGYCDNLWVAIIPKHLTEYSENIFPSHTKIVDEIFTIIYDANGGTNAPESQTKYEGIDIKLSSETPTRVGYSFVGWTKHGCSSDYYTAGSSFEEDNNTVLYALWARKCTACNGTGRHNQSFRCNYCNGSGSTETKGTCTTCSGTGQQTYKTTLACFLCSTGYINGQPCPLCKGTRSYIGEKTRTCPSCIGTGKTDTLIECSHCNNGYIYQQVDCSDCKGKGSITLQDKHKFDDGIVSKEASCTKSGTKKFTCEICGETETEKIPTLGHDFSDEYTIDKESTCTEDGLKSRHCSRCDAVTDETQIEKLGHNFAKYISNNNATCTENGTKTAHCTRCDVTNTKIDSESVKGHSPSSEWTVAKQSTETETGLEVKYCLDCGDIVDTRIIPVIENQHPVENPSEPDFTEPTEPQITESPTLEATEPSITHKLKTVDKKSPTYFSKGYAGDKVCTVCGKTVSKGKTIAKLKLSTPKVKITAGKKKLTVKYTKVKNAAGFQVKYTYKGKTKTKTYNTKKSVSKVIKKLKKGTYKVKVRAFIKKNKKTAYSGWTKAKKVKVK